jgi:hypothetical protein
MVLLRIVPIFTQMPTTIGLRSIIMTVLRRNYRRGLKRAKLRPNLKGENPKARTSVDDKNPACWG